MRTYQHLKLAFCHLNNQIALEEHGVDKTKIREYAIEIAHELKNEINKTGGDNCRVRKVFVSAICPQGENAFFDCFKDKRIIRVVGGEVATETFFDELKGLTKGTYILNPLDPNRLDGVIVGDVAVVRDAGEFNDAVKKIDLTKWECFDYPKEIEQEKNGVVLEVAFAVEELNKAREFHLELEKYFVAAMDFSNNNRLYDEIVKACFC